MADYIFKTEGLKKEYSGKTVLDIEEMEIQKGKITAVIGPSGAGKSTLLHLLNVIEAPSSGSIWFEDSMIGHKALTLDIRRSMVMVFQKPLVFTATVYENLAYGLKLRKMKKEEISQKVEEVLEITGLKDKRNQNAATLSGGEAQRVAIGRAMVVRPKALLLDEPTANLDPANISIIEDLIKFGKANYGLSVIIVTHNMFQAKRLSDNTIFMLNGKIIDYDTTESLFNCPKNEITGAFIDGKMIY
ncbi:ABC transporter ATP-binding protein [Lutispora saccharofermentans]|uniref:Phosphate ABC transporter ATP-binding protein n=1 Tax=Lutispora saccharofermentans TaxID=3024236 RepID=A0ABT1NBS6_9FIRM|nr:phosphate ABC transporter ATP-binding protein [Lutispora saccharofermentans]MCQ1528697.1 phosphate ABC transporter ATP-binding protein [Lutispora saccharofermentans]